MRALRGCNQCWCGARRLRARVRLADAYLKMESALTWVSAIAMFIGWAGLVGWGIIVPAQPVSPACLPTMQGCGLTHSVGPSLTTTWWLIVVAMGLAMLRATAASFRAVRERRRLGALAVS